MERAIPRPELPMKSAVYLLAMAILQGCSSGPDSMKGLRHCWTTESTANGHLNITDADILYLRGHSLIVLSSICPGSRLQVMEQPPSVLEFLRGIETKPIVGPIVLRGTIEIEPLRQDTSTITEVNLISTGNLTLLSSAEARQIASRLR